MASAGTVGRRVRTAGRFVAEASDTLLLTAKTPLVRRKLSFQSRMVALVPIGAAPLSSPDSSAGATTLARKVPRRALGSRGRTNVVAISGAGSYRYRLVRVWNSAEPLQESATADRSQRATHRSDRSPHRTRNQPHTQGRQAHHHDRVTAQSTQKNRGVKPEVY
jgi:hypothetical protein